MRRVKDVLSVAGTAQRPSDLPASLGSRIAFALGSKTVIREMHDSTHVHHAAERWRKLGLEVVIGDSVVEHCDTGAQAIDPARMKSVPPQRPLNEHPVVARALAIGGPLARMVLLAPRSPIYRWLAVRLGADQTPERTVRHGVRTRQRQAVYIALRHASAQDACRVDAMSGHREDAVKLGALLGYPGCCVKAYAQLDIRYPNIAPISAAAERTRRFEPLLNNLSLSRFGFIAHFPCRYDCQHSLAQAQAIRSALSNLNPRVTSVVQGIFSLPRVYRSEDDQHVLLSARRVGDRIAHSEARRLDDLWTQGSVQEASSLPGRHMRIATRGDELVLPFGV